MQGVEIKAPDLQIVRELYDRGLYVQAYRQAEACGPLKCWRGTAARLMAGRLAGNLGAPRLAQALHYLAWRSAPENPEAVYFHSLGTVYRLGPAQAWEIQERYGDLPDAPAQARADFCALRARTFGYLRDFDAAEDWMRRAESLGPNSAWIKVERSHLLQMEDRYDDALTAARQALELRPWYRPGVEAAADVLELLGRDDEASALLTEAGQRLESPSVVLQLARLLNELGQYDRAVACLDRACELAVLKEKGFTQWIEGRKSDVAHTSTALGQLARHAQPGRSFLGQAIGEHLLEGDRAGRRIQLPVQFVRQHHSTCVPATLTAISRYWGRAADHLSVAQEICYDGTLMHEARSWAERNGWLVAEFTANWQDAVALIDRGIPFAISWNHPAGGHTMAVIGYDNHRHTWLLRDPFYRHTIEIGVPDDNWPDGPMRPQGMVLVPDEQPALLDGLTLSDRDLYDQLYRIQTALQDHDRKQAQSICDHLQQESPEHLLTYRARLSLAAYDGDETARMQCVESLLARCPDDAILLLMKLAGLRNLGRREDRLKLLEAVCGNSHRDPLFWQEYADELSQDARQEGRAIRHVRRALRIRPTPGGLRILANILWARREFERAFTFYRFAACMADKDESAVSAYFQASRHVKKTEEVLGFLKNRIERAADRSSMPAQTLAWACLQLDRTQESLAMLDAAMSRFPDDGDLILFAANTCSSIGDLDRAAALLEQARGRCRPGAWLRAAARLAAIRGQLDDARRMWQEVLATEPLAIDAHRTLAMLLAATESGPAALRHLEQAAERFPQSYPVNQLWIQWLSSDDPCKAEQATRRLLTMDPADVWAHRQLALVLADLHRWDEALSEARQAVDLSPTDAYSIGLMGHLLFRTDKRAEARQALEQAISLSVDLAAAIGDLVALCETVEEKQKALAFVHEQLVRQVIFGDGLLAYCSCARGVLTPRALLDSLREALAARPDLCQTWTAVIRQLVNMKQFDEAAALAAQATDHFSMVPAVWQTRADVHLARGDADAALSDLENAYRLNQNSPEVVVRLAGIYQGKKADPARARALLEGGVARTPLDAACHGSLADLLWQTGDREGAVKRLETALRLDPRSTAIWDRLVWWGQVLGRPNLAADLARDLLARRGDDPAAWLTLARVLSGPAHLRERLEITARVVQIAPYLVEAHDLRAEVLAEAGRSEEAVAACRPAVFENHRPAALRRREALILANSQNPERAVGTLRELLKDNPTDRSAWAQLIDHLEALGWLDDANDASERLVQLDPGHPVPYGYRGHIRLRRGQVVQAAADFRRALALDPEYDYAAHSLLDIQLKANLVSEAEQTLSQLKACATGPRVTVREIQVAAARLDEPTALAKLRELALSASADVWLLNTALEALLPSDNRRIEAAWRNRVGETLESLMAEPQANMAVGPAWLKYIGLRTKRRKLWQRLDQLRAAGPAGWAATEAYAEELADPKRVRLLRRFVRRYGDSLKSRTSTWGQIGHSFVTVGQYRLCARWMADWQSRDDAEPWALLNAAASMRRLGRDKEAARISLHALTLPRDHTSWRHEMLLAIDAALDGQTARAAGYLQAMPDMADSPQYYRFIHGLVSAVLAAANASPQDRRNALRLAGTCLADAMRGCPSWRQIPVLARYYRRAVRRVARDAGGFRAWIWAFGKLLGAPL